MNDITVTKMKRSAYTRYANFSRISGNYHISDNYWDREKCEFAGRYIHYIINNTTVKTYKIQ